MRAARRMWPERPVCLRQRQCMARSSMAGPRVSKPAVHVRQGTPADAQTLCGIIQQAYRTDRSWTTEVNLVAGQRITAEQLHKQLAAGTDPIFVATVPQGTATHSEGDAQGGGCNGSAQSQQVVGCICAETANNHSDVGLASTDVLLGLFAVSPELQSAGIGSRLLAHALQHAQAEMGSTRAVLWVIHTRTELLAWYERLGFEWSGETKPFVFPDLSLVEDLHFRVLTKQL